MKLILDPQGNVDHSESIFIEITNSNGKNIIVGNIYRAHGTDTDAFVTDLSHCLTKITAENKHCYVSGDFNLDLLKYDNNNLINNFVNMFYNHCMFPSIDRPTRITYNSATLLDNIFTNVIDHKIKSGIFVAGITDHFPIYQITSSISTSNCRAYPNYYKSRLINEKTIHDFHNQLCTINWDFVTEINCPNTSYNLFLDKFTEIYNSNFPVKTKKSTKSRRSRIPQKPWITHAILKSMRRKEKLYKKTISHPTTVNKTLYSRYRNKLTTLIRAAKKKFYAEKLEHHKHNSKQTWKVLNDILGRSNKSKLPNSFYINDILNSDPKIIANNFNDFFANLGLNLAQNIPPTNLNFHHYLNNVVPPINSLFFKPIDTQEIVSICNSLKSGTSGGFDDIKSDVVKSVKELIAYPLTHIFNCSLTSGIVLDKLKIARVVPIYKSGKTNIFSNYRPISVLPFFSKILERIVHKRLYNFISRFDLLHKSQFGFRPGRSSYMAILEAYNKITSSIDSKNNVIGIFLDLSKAFDTINHDILLSKLSHYGVRGSAFEWFKSYLSGRTQFTSFNNHDSTSHDIIRGIPQGSILGPLLFILYLNDIVYSSKLFTFYVFADDTNLLASHKNLRTLIHSINNELGHVST